MVLLYRHQYEFSIYETIELNLSRLMCSAEERARVKSALMKFYFSDETLGHGLNDKTFTLLKDKSNSGMFIEWTDANKVHPEAATMLPLLEEFYELQADHWETISHDHVLSFLLGSYEQRVYWFSNLSHSPHHVHMDARARKHTTCILTSAHTHTYTHVQGQANMHAHFHTHTGSKFLKSFAVCY